MAEHPNIAIARKGYEAFATGDVKSLEQTIADDVIWHVEGRSQLAGTYKGRQEVFGFFGKIAELSGGTFKLDIHDVIANDEHVVVLARSTAERNGKKLDDTGVQVWHVKDGKATEQWLHPGDAHATDEFFND